MFDKKAALGAAHAEARNLSLQTAVLGSPVAFSAGALKYYREHSVEPAPASIKP